ncbi:MAG: YraN family protein [Bacteroidetes bacterium]|nr:YraN family protein [Bacteroidota bacterium]
MTATHLETGQKGEEIARDFLLQKGYRILEVNWRTSHHEIDIIAQKDNFLVIAEVKTRSGKPLVDPEVSVDLNKQRLLIKAANSYIRIHDINIETRFDIIAITLQGKEHHIHHIEDAFYPRVQR